MNIKRNNLRGRETGEKIEQTEDSFFARVWKKKWYSYKEGVFFFDDDQKFEVPKKFQEIKELIEKCEEKYEGSTPYIKFDNRVCSFVVDDDDDRIIDFEGREAVWTDDKGRDRGFSDIYDVDDILETIKKIAS